MNTSKFLFLFLILGALFSCKDDFDPLTELNGTPADVMAMLQSEDVTQRARIDSDNFTFTSRAGNTFSAEPNSFVFEDGTLVTGMIDFELTELYTKSDILRYGIPTMTFNSEILESDGEFLFVASQDDRELRLASGKRLDMVVRNPEPNPGMQLFQEVEGLWGATDIPVNTFVVGDTVGGFPRYETFSDRLEWVNIDYFTKFDLDLTDISICLPEGYKEDQVAVWIIFKEYDVVLPSGGRNLPIGEEVYVVCIAAENEDTFRLDIQEITVAEDLKVNLEPKRTSEEDIKQRLAELD